MSVATEVFRFDDSFARELEGMYDPWHAAPAPDPRLVLLNRELAVELGLDADALASPGGVAVLVGNEVVPGSQPIAMAYSGHQFGSWSPLLGDGRALLLGELIDPQGRRHDLHLKGSGRTRFARGGDGKAVLGPMLREYVISEAMHSLGIPTTRSLAVVATGERVARERLLPGALLVRTASSHLRVGSFQYAASTGDAGLLRRLLDHAIARHHPDAADAPIPALAFFSSVLQAQARLVAQWMHVGFVHGVMNTDNTTISGETIDYGPCAFVDRHDPATVFSSIDHGGRYAYGNQPRVLQWNLARLAEALLPLIDPDTARAVELATAELVTFDEHHLAAWRSGMRRKLGLTGAVAGAADLDRFVDDVPAMLTVQQVDHTLFFRRLADAVRGDGSSVRALFADPTAFDAWDVQRRALVGATEPAADAATAAAMDAANPIYIPRNHQVEAALEAATEGVMAPVRALIDVVRRPFDERPGLDAYAVPSPDRGPYRTFCGT
ncbi:MAG: YdiU family protein [Acidimicrobiales bacterium]